VHDLMVCNLLSSLVVVKAFHFHLRLFTQLSSGLASL
jgi:hypothetical protein